MRAHRVPRLGRFVNLWARPRLLHTALIASQRLLERYSADFFSILVLCTSHVELRGLPPALEAAHTLERFQGNVEALLGPRAIADGKEATRALLSK